MSQSIDTHWGGLDHPAQPYEISAHLAQEIQKLKDVQAYVSEGLEFFDFDRTLFNTGLCSELIPKHITSDAAIREFVASYNQIP
jgi:hypothetical protein